MTSDEELPRVEHDDAGWWAVMRARRGGAIVRLGPYESETTARYDVAVSRMNPDHTPRGRKSRA